MVLPVVVQIQVLQVQVREGEIEVWQGEALRADAVFYADISSYLGLLTGRIRPDEAVAKRLIRIEGEAEALERFLSLCGLPN